MIFGIKWLNPSQRNTQVLYISSSRILWSLAMSYIIYACVTSNGGLVNKFLSWSILRPFSKLSFCSYLIQFSVIQTFSYSQDHPFHLQWSSYVIINIYFVKSKFNLLIYFKKT